MDLPQPFPDTSTRLRIRVHGVVQGVGFRPFVWRTAMGLGLTGWTRNDSQGVLIEVQGAAADQFSEKLRACPPPLARIDALWVDTSEPVQEESGFSILQSDDVGRTTTTIPLDTAPCANCLEELFDPANARH